jgi:hypothetical protein
MREQICSFVKMSSLLMSQEVDHKLCICECGLCIFFSANIDEGILGTWSQAENLS